LEKKFLAACIQSASGAVSQVPRRKQAPGDTENPTGKHDLPRLIDLNAPEYTDFSLSTPSTFISGEFHA
jgi:hypothetical protein